LTGHGDIEMAVQALKIGAFDFIEKPFDMERLLASVAAAVEVSANSLKTTLELNELRQRYASLSDRQRDTMHFLVKGLSNKEIAQELGISPRTVEIHRTWVMTRMAAKSMADLVRMGIALGIA
jgi:two-component system response regulator FixJ